MSVKYKEKQQSKYGKSELVSQVPIKPANPIIMYRRVRGTYTDERGNQLPSYTSKCMCLECQNQFDVLNKKQYSYYSREGEIACTECGAVSEPNVDLLNGYKSGKNGALTMVVPKMRSIYKSVDENGATTKVDEVTSCDAITFYVSDKVYVSHEKAMTSYDLQTGKVTKGYVAANEKNTMFKTVDNLFAAGSDNDKDRSSVSRYECTVYPMRINEGEQYYMEAKHSDLRFREASVCAKYDAICAEPLGLPKSSEIVSAFDAKKSGKNHPMFDKMMQGRRMDLFDTMNSMCHFATQYPGVVKREMERYDENYKYHPENFSTPALDKFEKMMQTERTISLMDSKLSSDLMKAKTPEQVDDILRAVTFGQESQSDVKMSIDVASAETDPYGTTKSLKKEYNKNPYAVASNVRTIRKLGLTDPSHVKQMLDIASATQDKSTQFSSYGVLKPIESKEELRFMRTYSNTHTPSDLIKDWYSPDAKGASTFKDNVRMYELLIKSCEKGDGILARTREDAQNAQIIDAQRQVQTYVSQRSVEDAYNASTFVRAWGPRTKEVVDAICDVQARNDAAGYELPVYFAGRDGKVLFNNRTPSELHDELSALQSKCKHTNKQVIYSDEVKERFNLDINGFHFRLPQDTNELVATGEKLQICVGSYGDSVASGREHVIIMYDDDYTAVGCLSTNRQMTGLDQAKGYHNGMICHAPVTSQQDITPEDAVKALEMYCEQTELETRSSDDFRARSNPNRFPHGNRDFSGGRRVTDYKLPSADVIIEKMNECKSQTYQINNLKKKGEAMLDSQSQSEDHNLAWLMDEEVPF